MAGLDLSFIVKDVEQQKDMARSALREAEKLKGEMVHIEDKDARMLLEKAHQSLLDFARGLAENASYVSKSANIIAESARPGRRW